MGFGGVTLLATFCIISYLHFGHSAGTPQDRNRKKTRNDTFWGSIDGFWSGLIFINFARREVRESRVDSRLNSFQVEVQYYDYEVHIKY